MLVNLWIYILLRRILTWYEYDEYKLHSNPNINKHRKEEKTRELCNIMIIKSLERLSLHKYTILVKVKNDISTIDWCLKTKKFERWCMTLRNVQTKFRRCFKLYNASNNSIVALLLTSSPVSWTSRDINNLAANNKRFLGERIFASCAIASICISSSFLPFATLAPVFSSTWSLQ